MLRFFDSIFNNWGLAIILLTLLIKFAFLPLTRKSFTSMAAMQELQPEITALRARLKDDPTRMNQEMMALYKKNKVNPVGGCFPILIQIPVFLGLYNALNYSIELRHAPFALWIKDLSAPELFYVGSFGIPVMVILMGISMFIQQWTTPSTMDPMQKKIMMVMPVIFTFMFIGFPAGLVLYWLTNNVISIVQQHYIRKASIRLATQATILSSLLFFGFAFALTLLKY
jgi:YidC/Oxa1 family membrane protein insertase